MSVIRVEKEDFVKLEQALQNALDHHLYDGTVVRVVEHSRRFQREFWWSFHVKDGRTQIRADVLGRLVWYCQVANRIAYALQYKEEPDLFGDADEDPAVSCFPASAEDLRGQLERVRYNLTTNDGNHFLATDWWELLESLIDQLAQHELSQQERHRGVAAVCGEGGA